MRIQVNMLKALMYWVQDRHKWQRNYDFFMFLLNNNF